VSHSSTNPADSWFGGPPPEYARPPAIPRPQPAAHLSDVVINECIDLESHGEIHEASAMLRRASVEDPALLERYHETRRVLRALETGAPTGPDLTNRIIAGVDERRPFLPARSERMYSSTRAACVSGLLAALAVSVVVQWRTPQVGPSATESPEVAVGDHAILADSFSTVRSVGASIATDGHQLRFGNDERYRVGTHQAVSPPHAFIVNFQDPPSRVVTSVPSPHEIARPMIHDDPLLTFKPNASITRTWFFSPEQGDLAEFLGLRRLHPKPSAMIVQPDKQIRDEAAVK